MKQISFTFFHFRIQSPIFFRPSGTQSGFSMNLYQKYLSYIIVFLLFLVQPLSAKEIYFTRTGNISFFSTAILEDIKAINSQVTCVMDLESGMVSFRVFIPGFIFENALMQEHFNENYLESETFPTANFNGKIDEWETLQLSEIEQEITLSGKMTIHGVSMDISEKGHIFMKNGLILGKTIFKIKVADYGIEIPKIVRDNIAKQVDITVDLKLKKK